MSLELKFDEDIFGITVSLESENVIHTLGTFEGDIGKRCRARLPNSFWFRSPTASIGDLKGAISRISEMTGKWSMKLSPIAKSENFYAIVKLDDEDDAKNWSFSQIKSWQRWSRTQEEEAIAENKHAKKNKPKLSADGKTVTVTVTSTTLGDEDPE